MNNDNVFFNDTPDEIDSTPVDLSNITAAEIIPQNAVMLKLELCGSTLQKQFGSSEVVKAEGVDCTLVKTSKSLIDKKYLDPITRLDSRMKADLYQMGMRPKFLGTGNVIIPIRLLNYVIKRIDRFRGEREQLVDVLISRYEAAKLETLTRNPDLYKEEEYPSESALRDMFTVSYNIFSVSFPDTLERIEAETVRELEVKAGVEVDAVKAETVRILSEQRTRQQKQLEDAVDEVRMGLRAGMYELVNNLEDKVKGIGTERKVFKPGFITGFRTFLETFDAKNITDDVELADMVNRAKAVLSGVSPDAIRENLDLRLKLEDELGSIKSQLGNMVQPMERAASFR